MPRLPAMQVPYVAEIPPDLLLKLRRVRFQILLDKSSSICFYESFNEHNSFLNYIRKYYQSTLKLKNENIAILQSFAVEKRPNFESKPSHMTNEKPLKKMEYD